MEDFGYLLSFIRVQPFDDPAFFRRQITPLARQDPDAIDKLRALVHRTSLRRTKDSVSAQLNLPNRVDHTETITLSEYERKLYDFTREHARKLLDKQNREGRCYGSMHQVILRLRQICNHGVDLFPTYLRSKWKGIIDVLDRNAYLDLDEFMCEACGRQIPEEETRQLPSRLVCPHVLCTQCSDSKAASGKSKKPPSQKRGSTYCPLCFPCDSLPDSAPTQQGVQPKLQSVNYQPSSKVVALLKNLSTSSRETKRLSNILRESNVTRKLMNFRQCRVFVLDDNVGSCRTRAES
jgi:SNF2 family DNA or RNA helicase